MWTIRCVVLALMVMWLGAFVNPAGAVEPKQQLNVVFVLVDDMGWTDLGCYGSDLYQSPNIDRLAREGMRFTQAYAACTVCSPTRAAVLTGKYPGRLRITDWIPGLPPSNPKLIVPDFVKQLPHEETTIAEVLKANGYATASIGKWHLGNEAYYPEHHGFDLNIAGTHEPRPVPGYFAPYKIETIEQGPDGEYITDRLGDEAVKFIQANAERPFFLYLPHFAVHTPIQGKKKLVQMYAERVKEGMRHTNAAYAAMIHSLDEAVGKVRKALKEEGIADRTVIILTSDNGGRIPTTSNVPLRAGKGGCYEGGVRVPLIVYWPAPGSDAAGRVSDEQVISVDHYPTILEMVGVEDAAGHKSDGLSIVPVLRGEGELAERPLFWHYPHYQHYQQGGTTPYGAIRRGDYKLIEYFDDMRVELYNLAEDISERRNLAAIMPERADALRDELHAWRAAVKAQMPTRNPEYDPSRPEHDPPKKNK